ncbi:Hypothetical predicted protein [Paramuricea clavata]|uniref:Uncharacterized protein n=1 Tax=Paramuricea clavata TaxID=317549 RepID=A0A6S7ITE7_PARCT|nr:Hypothetical predicted protein [Paramuricea clavata]
MSESESDPDLTLERYDLEDDQNAYGSPVYISPREELTGVEAAAVEPLNEPTLAADDDRTQKDVHVEVKQLIAKTRHRDREQLPPQMQEKTHLNVSRSQSTKQNNRLRNSSKTLTVDQKGSLDYAGSLNPRYKATLVQMWKSPVQKELVMAIRSRCDIRAEEPDYSTNSYRKAAISPVHSLAIQKAGKG